MINGLLLEESKMISNIFNSNSEKINEEVLENLIKTDSFLLERIISEGHTTPEGYFYDQKQNEFVLLLKGFAKIAFEDCEVELKEGDYLIIPAHKKHRVTYTSEKEKTFWLTLYY